MKKVFGDRLKLLAIFKTTCSVLILLWLISFAIFNQVQFTFKPLAASRAKLPALLIKDDMAQLNLMLPDIGRLFNIVNSAPAEAKFYFVPYFTNSPEMQTYWWYLYLASRYFSYPREVYCHDHSLYKSNKDIYLKRWIGQAKTFDELPWLNDRHVQYIIRIQHNILEIVLPKTAIGEL